MTTSKYIDESKKNGEAAVARLYEQGITLCDLSGTEKQILWAQQIRAVLYYSKVSWAIKKLIAENAPIRATAKYWIDNRNRSSDDWCRIALPETWQGNYEYDAVETIAAGQVLARVITRGYGMVDQINEIAKLSAEIVADKRPLLAASNGAQNIDYWLVCMWARTGLVEFLQKRIDDALDKAAPAIDAAKVSEKIDADKRIIAEADRIANTVDHKIRMAEQKKALAAHLDEQADAALEIAALRLGTKSIVNGTIWICRELMDDGARIHCSNENSSIWIELTKWDFIAGVQAFAMHQQYSK